MLVEADKVVTFHYRLSEPGQEVFEDLRNAQPVACLHGYPGRSRASKTHSQKISQVIR